MFKKAHVYKSTCWHKRMLTKAHVYKCACANTASNLRHLQRQHASMKLVAVKDRTGSDAEEMLLSQTPTKQARLDFEQTCATKAEIDGLVAAYIVEEMLPVSTVELPSFWNILSKIHITWSGCLPSDRKNFASFCCHLQHWTQWNHLIVGCFKKWPVGLMVIKSLKNTPSLYVLLPFYASQAIL